MSVGFMVRSLGADVSPSVAVDVARQLDVRCVAFDAPPSAASAWRQELKTRAVVVAAVGADGGDRLDAAIRAAATLRAQSVVVDGPTVSDPDAREVETDRFVRALHAALASGATLALRPGAGESDLLGPEAMEWVLEDLPRVRVWFDGGRATLLARQELAPAPGLWAEALAGRTIGVTVSGLVGDEQGGHPEEGGLDWSTLALALPRSAAWIVDIDPRHGRAALADAVRFTQDLVG